MGLIMKKIIDKYSDCDMFSLTGGTLGLSITEEEFLNALNKMEEQTKEEKRKEYENNKDKFINYPKFDELYEEIKKECYEFDCEKNKEIYLNKHFNKQEVKQLKKIGMTDEEINKIKENFFQCSFITSEVGYTTKYGKESKGFFWHLYHDISMNIDCSKKKNKYCIKNGKNILEQIPKELKEHALYYEISFSNAVTLSNELMINYYFKLNEETKKYLLKFRNDFCLEELEDLTLYKDNKIKFSSCTHEGFNSEKLNYKKMNHKEIIDFINDEYFGKNNEEIIEIVNKLVEMEKGTVFSFKELNINNKKNG
ncbi:MAG: hypothetical protein IJE89_00280 [Bacilli bacterium]|nr:hypothetical protein [Bacilli bacterium]